MDGLQVDGFGLHGFFPSEGTVLSDEPAEIHDHHHGEECPEHVVYDAFPCHGPYVVVKLVECAEAVAGFVNEGTKNIFLCHLSEHNNTPKLALETVKGRLEGDLFATLGVTVIALPHRTPSPLFEL